MSRGKSGYSLGSVVRIVGVLLLVWGAWSMVYSFIDYWEEAINKRNAARKIHGQGVCDDPGDRAEFDKYDYAHCDMAFSDSKKDILYLTLHLMMKEIYITWNNLLTISIFDLVHYISFGLSALIISAIAIFVWMYSHQCMDFLRMFYINEGGRQTRNKRRRRWKINDTLYDDSDDMYEIQTE